MKLYLLRDYKTPEVRLGRLFSVEDNFHIHTLELPWLDNKPRISCIPPSTYICKRDFYHKGGYAAFEIMDVPDRSDIKIHIANWTKDIQGCVAVGMSRHLNTLDLQVPMVSSSRTAFNELMDYVSDEDEFELEIIEI